MLLALIEDCIRSDASANLCKTVTDSLVRAICERGGVIGAQAGADRDALVRCCLMLLEAAVKMAGRFK
jgi:hypothetical protein